MQSSLDSKPFYLSFGIFLFLVAGTFVATLYIIVAVKLWTAVAIKDSAKSVFTLIETKANNYITSYYGLMNTYSSYYANNPAELKLLFNSTKVKDSFGVVNYVALLEKNELGVDDVYSYVDNDKNSAIAKLTKLPELAMHIDRAFTNNKPVLFNINGLNYTEKTDDLVAVIPLVSSTTHAFIFVNIGYENLLNPLFKSDITKVLIPMNIDINDVSESENKKLVFTTTDNSKLNQTERKSYKNTYSKTLTMDELLLNFTFTESKELNSLTRIKQIPFVITLIGLFSSLGSYVVIYLSLTNFKENYKRYFLLQKAKTQTIK